MPFSPPPQTSTAWSFGVVAGIIHRGLAVLRFVTGVLQVAETTVLAFARCGHGAPEQVEREHDLGVLVRRRFAALCCALDASVGLGEVPVLVLRSLLSDPADRAEAAACS